VTKTARKYSTKQIVLSALIILYATCDLCFKGPIVRFSSFLAETFERINTQPFKKKYLNEDLFKGPFLDEVALKEYEDEEGQDVWNNETIDTITDTLNKVLRDLPKDNVSFIYERVPSQREGCGYVESGIVQIEGDYRTVCELKAIRRNISRFSDIPKSLVLPDKEDLIVVMFHQGLRYEFSIIERMEGVYNVQVNFFISDMETDSLVKSSQYHPFSKPLFDYYRGLVGEMIFHCRENGTHRTN